MVSPNTAVLNPQARPGGLLTVTQPLPGGWERGLDIVVGSLLSPDRAGPCPVGSGETQARGDVARFAPVVIRQGVVCSTLGRPDTAATARAAVAATVSWALAAEVTDGAATSNPALVDAVDLGVVPDLAEAVGVLEEDADQALSGRLAVIHVPVGLAARLDDIVYRDGDVLRTLAGNLVAVHGQGDTIYATGEIWASYTTIDAREYIDRATNTAEGWGDVLAMAVFDPAYIASVSLTAPDSPTSPTSP